MDLGLEGKAAVVTGASAGIGLEVAGRLRAAGASVLMISRDEDRLAGAAGELGATHLAADVTDPEAGDRIVAACVETLGSIDVLVNNAGTSAVKALDELTDDDWRHQHELNVLGPMRLMRAAAPLMARTGWGRIVNVSSTSGKRPSLRNPAYSVSKAGLLSLSRTFADAYAGTGVLVNAITPSVAATGLWTGAGGMGEQTAQRSGVTLEQALEQVAASQPIGRLAEPGEIADVIVFLSSERASMVTGAAWSVDGGAFAAIV